jgi:hypothetical protein
MLRLADYSRRTLDDRLKLRPSSKHEQAKLHQIEIVLNETAIPDSNKCEEPELVANFLNFWLPDNDTH